MASLKISGILQLNLQYFFLIGDKVLLYLIINDILVSIKFRCYTQFNETINAVFFISLMSLCHVELHQRSISLLWLT